MKKANLILIFTVLTALAIALPQMAFAQGAGKALDFDGGNDYVQAPDSPSLDITDAITVEAWIYPRGLDAWGWKRIVEKNSWIKDGWTFFHSRFYNSELYVDIDGDCVNSNQIISENQWQHVAFTYNSVNLKIYYNGKEVYSAPKTYTLSSTNPLIVGHANGGGDYFNGKIDEVRIWNVAHTEAQIRANMCKKLAGTEDNLVGYWRFDESGTGTTCYDQTSNDNDGAMTNMDPATDRVWSGAAVGDDAVYTTTASTINLVSSEGDDITLENIGGSPDMVALLRVDEAPNYTGVSGLDYVYTSRYWEVWMSGGTSPDYDLVYNYDGYSGLGDEDSLRLGYRADAAVTQWSNSWVNPNTTANTLTLRNQTANQQYILGSHSVKYITQGAGKALDFDGINDYVDCGNDASLNSTTAITIEAWVKTTENKTAKIAEKGDWDGHGIYQDTWNGWKGAIHIDGDGGYSLHWTEGVPTFNQWYHIALTYDGSALRLYVDGVEKNNISSLNGNLRINSRDFVIGSNNGAQKFFKGTIDEVCIWDVALTEAQIRETMCKKINSGNLPSGLLWSSLKGYWRFDESSGTSCTDYSGNDNTGTMHNMDPATDRVWSTAAFGDEGERKIGSTPNVPTSDNLDLYLNFTNGVGSGAILAAIENNEAPVDGTKPTDNISERYWDIQFLNTDGDDTYSANAQFYWSGLGGMGPEKAFRLLSRPSAGENWSEVSSYSIDETNDYFQTTATSFTQFAMGYNDPATFVYPGFPKAKYVLLGVPVIPSNGNPNSVLADDFDNKTAGVDWRFSRWNVQHNTYIRFNETDADGQEHGDPPDFSPGKGYWIYQNVLNTTDIDVEGYEVSQGQDFSIPLDAPIGSNRGLNMTSNPFNFKIDWSNSKVSDGSETKSIEDAATAGWVSQYAYTWNSNNSQYVPLTPDDASNADTISVWQGFWTIQMDDSRSCKLLMPPTKILGKKSAPLPQWLSDHLEKGANHLPAQSQESWFLKLSVRSESGDIRDTYNGLGVSQDALSEYDHHDAFEFTPNATEFVMLYFPHNDPEDAESYWQDQPYHYTYDIRNTDWEQAEWLFKVYQYGAPGDYRLNWSGMRLIPQTVRLSLYDAETGDEMASLRQSRGINFSLSDGEQSRSFEVRAELIEDNISPEFTIGITQNPILTDDIDVYVLPSEKLTNIVADVNGVELEMTEIDPMNIVYRCDYELEGSGNFTVNVSGSDLSDNDGEGSVTFSAQLMKSVSGGTIQSPDRVLSIEVPGGALGKEKYITILSEDGEEDLSELSGVGLCYQVNPGINLLHEAELSLRYCDNDVNGMDESKLCIYFKSGSEWIAAPGKVNADKNLISANISSLGTYRLFYNPEGEVSLLIPKSYSLEQNYPNPFNATTFIRYHIPEDSRVTLRIFNIIGQEVKVLVSELQSSGCYSLQWDGTNRFGLVVPSGVYFYCLESKGFRSTKNCY